MPDPSRKPASLPVESTLGALRLAGHDRTGATAIAIEEAAAAAFESSTVLLVEGVSDQIALELLAARCGRNLRGEGISIVPMGGATNIRRFVTLFRAHARLAGIHDAAQKGHVRRVLEQTGVDCAGFFVCVDDLEDELIRCLGADRVEQIIEAEGDLRSFRRMQNEPFHRERTHAQQLHRFVGVHSGRKYRYARLFAEALDPAAVPEPIERLLTHV